MKPKRARPSNRAGFFLSNPCNSSNPWFNMGWNGSDSGKVEVKGGGGGWKDKFHSSTSTFNFNYKALCAGLIVVLAGGLVAWLTLGRAQTPAAPKERKSSRIAAVEPRDRSKGSINEKEGAAPAARLRQLDEELALPSDVSSIRPGERVLTNAVPESAKTFAQKVFTRPADIWIADLLTIDPGVQLVGTVTYPDFTKEFLKSVKEPIEIDPEDDEDVRLLKNAVKDVREDLLKRHAAGEDLNKVMTEARRELQELGTYREQLKQQVSEIEARDEDGRLTENDYKDLIDAANLMLKEHGAKPITMPAFIKYKFDKELLDDEN